MRLIRAGLSLLGALALTWCQSLPTCAQSETNHWAYKTPVRSRIPIVDQAAWVQNAIDAFTQFEMIRHKLTPSRQADRHTLIRRVTLDLTGLPPTPAEVAEFLADTRPDAYERLVDRLLQSPRFGERMATTWLDLARYADTHGYHMDSHREMWRWRDWVIAAYNDSMPFDQFTIEQLAGDLLPSATLSQRLATGFNRNNMVSFENGAIADELLVEYAVDRVTTTATVWLGQTLVCARCHDHKYDPISQRDFYRLYAFFDQVPENGLGGNKGNAIPFVAAPTPEQQEEINELGVRLRELEVAGRRRFEAADPAVIAWEATFKPSDTRSVSVAPELMIDFDEPSKELTTSVRGAGSYVDGKIGNALLFDGQTHVDLGSHEAFQARESWTMAVWLFPTTLDSMVVVEQTGKDEKVPSVTIQLHNGQVFVRTSTSELSKPVQFTSDDRFARFKWQHLAVRYDVASEVADVSLFMNGELVPSREIDDGHSDDRERKASLVVGSAEPGRSFRGMMDDLRVFRAALNDEDVAIIADGDPIGEVLAIARDRRTKQQTERLKQYYLEQYDCEYRQKKNELEATRRRLAEITAASPTSMVMQDISERKPTHILNQGHYDSPGDVVVPGVPAALPPLPPDGIANRLTLAKWLVTSDHPLTARVAVNQVWQTVFGAGLVRTPEDFGTRGERPTHPELLDWLATEFSSDWDVKRLIRLFVTSATYRQSNRLNSDLVEIDPENRWLARASRLRLSAEMVRDSALYASGLVVEQTGGPSVFPYQPEGLWEEIAYDKGKFTAQVYRQSHGADLYRRSLYTFLKRSLPSPTLAAFDLPSRETCVTKRVRTNTPQQALVLMNDVTFVEAARALAGKTMAVAATTEDRIDQMFLAALSRPAISDEHRALTSLLVDLRNQYEREPSLAIDLMTVGETAPDQHANQLELAIWTAVANVILSLDEAITRP